MSLSSAAAPGVVGAGRTSAAAQDVELARGVEVEARDLRIFGRLGGIFDALFGADRAEIGGQRVGIVGDVGRVDPVARLPITEVEQVLFDRGDEGAAPSAVSG